MRYGLIALLVVALPASAFATEPLAVHAEAASAGETEVEFQHRPQFVLSLDANDAGIGLRAGVHYRWAELTGGVESLIFSSREFVTLKLMPFPDAVATPYVYGRLGSWKEEALFGAPDDGGDYRSVGGGAELNMTRHSFVFLEMGYAVLSGARDPYHDGQGPEVNIGLGLRF
jgi:hypothetical protein